MIMTSRYKVQTTALQLLLLLVAAVSIGAWHFWDIPFLWTYLVGINCATFIFYGMDKSQSLRSGWRIPEITLHGLALIGGSPGALIGQILFRHKTRKRKFRIIFFLIILIQIAILLLIWIQTKNN